MHRIVILLTVLVAIGLSLLSLRTTEPPPRPAPIVLAAASLQESLEAAAKVWTDKGNPKPVLSFAASSVLARQIEAGAPVDLFISADEEWMDRLSEKGLIQPESRTTMLGNSLVLIAPAANAITLEPTAGFPLANALGNGKLALADPAGVPAGRYAKQALEHLGVWDSVANRVVAGDSVRAALALVARQEAALGIVYATDAAVEPKVRVVMTFPANSHTAITYPIATLTASRSPNTTAFRAFLLSAEGQDLFKRHGFTVPKQ